MSKKKKTLRKMLTKKIRWKYIDKNLVLFISKRRIRQFTSFMKFVTHIGDGLVWFLLVVLFLVLNVFKPGMAYTGIALAISSVIQVVLQTVFKHIFTRERPYIQHKEISSVIAPPDKFSFPSGHTAGAFAVAFVFLFFVPALFVPMLIVAALIGFSRMYLGLHYPTDILAGIVLGLVSAILGTNLTLLIEL